MKKEKNIKGDFQIDCKECGSKVNANSWNGVMVTTNDGHLKARIFTCKCGQEYAETPKPTILLTDQKV